MTVKIVGAALVIAACAGCGISMAAACRKEEKLLMGLLQILEYMRSELEYRLTPLPQLCRNAAEQQDNPLKKLFLRLASELESQISPDAACCMTAALADVSELPYSVRTVLTEFGQSLGRFDLNGQLREIEAVHLRCKQRLEVVQSGRDQRIRNYQTLGICAGIALVILFI